MSSITFTLRFDCNHCGAPVPFNGPLRQVTCTNCQKVLTPNPNVWTDQVSSAAQGKQIVGNPYTCIREQGGQKCSKCGSLVPTNEGVMGTETQIPCPHCGAQIETYPAPDWLKALLPSAIQIFGGERESSAGGASTLATDEQALKPIMLACPNCNAGLSITSEMERVLPCEHCNVDVFIPDAIWKRLHPVRTVQPWSIIHGENLDTAEEIRDRKREEANRIRIENENIERAANEGTEYEEVARRADRKSWIYAALILVAILIFASFMYFLDNAN